MSATFLLASSRLIGKTPSDLQTQNKGPGRPMPRTAPTTYRHVIETAVRVRALPHSGMRNVHFAAAASVITLKEFNVAQCQLELFLNADPTNPLSRGPCSNARPRLGKLPMSARWD